MFRMLMGSTWGTGPLLRPNMPKDPTVKAKLYTWSTEEFREEFALIYTSRYDPSQTCVSYSRNNRNKFLFTLYDCLCEGNTVRVDIELSTQRDYNGFIVFRDARVDESRGSFIVRTAAPGVSLLRYQDRFRQRTGQLWLYRVTREIWEIQFNTGFSGGSVLSYFIRVLCNPWKGLDVLLSGPHCEVHDFIRRPLGLCKIDHVQDLPPHDVMKQVRVVHQQMMISTEVREERQGNNVHGGGASHASIQNNNNAILNAAQTQGNFNGANFRDCHITIDSHALQLKGFNNST